MVRVIPFDNENIRSVLKRLKKACEKEGMLRDMRRHEYFETKSQRDKKKRFRALNAILHPKEPNLKQKNKF